MFPTSPLASSAPRTRVSSAASASATSLGAGTTTYDFASTPSWRPPFATPLVSRPATAVGQSSQGRQPKLSRPSTGNHVPTRRSPSRPRSRPLSSSASLPASLMPSRVFGRPARSTDKIVQRALVQADMMQLQLKLSSSLLDLAAAGVVTLTADDRARVKARAEHTKADAQLVERAARQLQNPLA